ncbi:MAG TPA: hypothetical protein VG673_22845, partial [Actinomycetota bacterium]|nr:hypothetical protein [Actinomycetota bacterium]
ELMGDTWQLPNRIQAGSASDRGGIISGDKFPPVAKPWERTGGLNDRSNTPVHSGPGTAAGVRRTKGMRRGSPTQRQGRNHLPQLPSYRRGG